MMIPSNKKRFIQLRREELNLSRGDLARGTGINIDRLYKYENGLSRPNLRNADKLAEFLKCERTDLYEEFGDE